jgi:hypothetical protein
MQTIETGDEAEIAYKGVCYIGFKDVPLEVYGNQIPTQIGAVLLDEQFSANPDVSLVVRDICERAGVPSARIDVSDIAGKYVLNEGLLVSQNGESSRKVLEDLMQFYLFTAVESGDGVIMFKSFDRGIFTTNPLPTEHYLPISENKIFEVTRTAKSQLPNKASLKFYNNNQKYDVDEIVEHFEEYTQENDFRIETQISTNPYEARQQARKILKLVTTRQRFSFTFKLPAPYYPYLELLGIVQLPNGEIVQIEKITLNPDYTIEVSARRYIGFGSFLYTPANPPSSNSFPSLIDPLTNGIPDVYFLDIPIINPNNPPNTIYICASARTTVNISFDGGASYVASVNHTATSTIGECETVLPSATGLDTVNTLNVQLFSGVLSSISASQFNTGSNLALIARQNNGVWEGELIQFRDVLPLGSDRYTISYLQRSVFNTQNFNRSNNVGDKFFLLKGDGAYYSFYANTLNVGQPITYQPIIAPWQNLNTTPTTTVNTVGNNYIPLAPTNIESLIDTVDNITITWDYPYINNSPFQNGTEIITYEVDILNGINAVVRTFSTSAQNITYFKVDQIIDGITLPFDVKVYRVSSIVGRGYSGDATISAPTPITGITGNIDADTFGGELPAFYLDRTNHTGTQAIVTISGLQTALDALQPLLVNQLNLKSVNNNTLLGAGDLIIDPTTIPNFNEGVDDRVSSLLVAGSGVSLTYNDTANTLTIDTTNTSIWGGITGNIGNQTDLQNALNAKQATLVNQLNLKSINGNSLLAGGDLQISYNDLSNRPVTTIGIRIITSNTTLAESDYNFFILASNAITITLPNGLSTGFTCTVQNDGTNTITFVASGTLNASGSTLVARFDTAQLIHIGSNSWRLVGKLT